MIDFLTTIKWRAALSAWGFFWGHLTLGLIGKQTTCPAVTLGAAESYAFLFMIILGAPLGAMALAEYVSFSARYRDKP